MSSSNPWVKIAEDPRPELFGPVGCTPCSLLYKTEGSVLDFGSGIGRNQEYLENNFAAVDYCDIPEMARNFPCKTFDQVKSNHYDMIYACFTFQHFLSEESIKVKATQFLDMTDQVYLITRSYCDIENKNVLQCFLDCGWHVLRYTIPPNVFVKLTDETCGEFLLIKDKLEDSDELIYIDYNQLHKDLIDWTRQQEFNYSAIYGIPRSGLIVATMLAEILDLPLYGEARPKSSRKLLDKAGPVLIIDDTSWTGAAMEHINLEYLNRIGWNNDVHYEKAAVYCSSYMANKLDIYYKILPTIKHTFAWNFLKDINVSNYTFDLDGVFTRDFEYGQDEGEKYLDFLENARPNIIPRYPVGKIVTARLEKYRPQTERWLDKYNIGYGELIMLPASSHIERSNINIPQYKAANYSGLLFVESALDQAIEIKKITNKKVFCTDIMEMIN